MHRVPLPSAGLGLVISLAAAAPSHAQSRTTLSPVEVIAPDRHAAPPRKPRPPMQSDRRVAQRAEPTAGATAGAVAAAARAAFAAPSPPATASEKRVSGAEINARPFSRPAEALEVVPGLIVTQHSGDGKANQYFLRGVNLDHGTDLAISIDGMPVNMRTHGHGQGYADLNFLIPELIGSVNIRKGPYFADEGDFSSAGAVHIGLLASVARTMASITSGSFGYRRGFGVTSTKLGEGTLLVAGEAQTHNGPWDNPDELRKLNGVMRYSQGTATDGFSLTAMAYANQWNSTDQVPSRAIASGQIGRFGALDPSDGGNASRFSLSGTFAQSDDGGSSKANFYVIKSSLNLWNNFTYYLSNPVGGDQFHQHDDRVLGGFSASHNFNHQFAGLRMQTEVGVQTRYDDIRLDLNNSVKRQFTSAIRSDAVKEGSVGLFVQNTVFWTDWLRTTAGWRGDAYNASVASFFNAANSGSARAFIGSPKVGVVFGPFAHTELFLNAGEGFHSNDARGVTISESPVDGSAVSRSPFLVKTKGAEVGLRSQFLPGLTSSVALFMLDSASEILFVGDAGDTVASRPSRRVGVEWTNDWRPRPWLSLEGDIAVTRARFRSDNPEQAAAYDELAGYPASQVGNAPGNLIPGAPNMVASAGIRLGEATGWFGALRYRYFGPRPLTEDGAFVSPAAGLLNGQLGYRFANGWRIQLDGFNLLGSQTDQITYAYGSLLKSDTLYGMCFSGTPTAPAAVCQTGVLDRVLHPVEPLALRVTVAGTF
ncbi:TonB-dependent receptor [Tardiphaga sp. vice352]|uniref:TonB-dependent receptor n=1 Tax=unclassified Tardiphaga TaxID=2631404 RepID=UPI0011645862|nr:MULTISPECIES: TonB-dependent receptor [unclassified Tardiphaga]QDM15554.1 TonB-dependent receptor [Tardiphaga sp. vice278]QDM20616.1 TonB-dependent receptor [Tardiphaga sp. vice154]QDM30953.1 TonB-dependent receptor [Tardiphaga sp. vice352]